MAFFEDMVHPRDFKARMVRRAGQVSGSRQLEHARAASSEQRERKSGFFQESPGHRVGRPMWV